LPCLRNPNLQRTANWLSKWNVRNITRDWSRCYGVFQALIKRAHRGDAGTPNLSRRAIGHNQLISGGQPSLRPTIIFFSIQNRVCRKKLASKIEGTSFLW
jgi:hypothetical protein